MDKEELKKLYNETTNKFVERMEHMLYFVNGCDLERGKVVLEECLKRNKTKKEKNHRFSLEVKQ